MKLKINLKSFDDLPILDVKTQINTPKKGAVAEIVFPEEFADQVICFLIGDEIAYFTADAHAMVTIKNKNTVKTLSKR